MSHRSPASIFREQLVRQLILLNEDKSIFLDHFFPQYGRERNKMSEFLDEYTQTIENLLLQTDDQLDSVALIGSHVKVVYLDDLTTDTYTIVYPEDTNPMEQRISFLSPVGHQLLLRSPGDSLSIDTPSGACTMQIEQISYSPVYHAVKGGFLAKQ